ncbi:TetR/AcrR family transcriptional regulator [Natranaerobius thermophilus]|uniref:Transcriptional regulator, TetR family n=1 Tax=Natranaerobius thermophilus (strain ATCC BAA-1301 / DSM 18059 / JW/NM-WN-LF) TaxID=457570 RepID=B2A6H4_NATTJ|nr:TetR/AcrR family transcriptional regulator [Natranaerobius thermophilus]ACB85507.1 transcriptional regulator, TetR family [Natranaerobius thermophilus JW/NM-WN-LF]
MLNIKKRQIIKAATQVFAEKGYHDTKIDEIAREADVAKGSVYLYFQSKEDLFIEMMKDGVKRYKDVKISVLEQDLPLYQKLKKMLIEEIEFLWDNQQVARFLLTSDIVTQDTLYNWLLKVRNTFIEKLTSEFDKAIETGDVIAGDSSLYTRIFRGVEHQVIGYYIIIDGKKPNEEMIDKALAALTKGIFKENN